MIAMARGDVRTICTRGILRVAFSVAIVGGMGTLWGPLIGALAGWFLRAWVAPT